MPCPVSAMMSAALIAGSPERHADASAVGREPDRVGQQVPEDLTEPRRITRDHAHRHAEVGLDGQPLALGHGPHGFDGAPHDGAEVHGLEVEPHAAQRDTREIEQGVDLARLEQRGMIEAVERPRDHAGLSRLLAQHLRPQANGVERVAQLVGKRPHQLVVEPVRPLRGDASEALPLQLLTEKPGLVGLGMRVHASHPSKGRAAGDRGLLYMAFLLLGVVRMATSLTILPTSRCGRPTMAARVYPFASSRGGQ
jgi:hypothetical protein